MLKSLLQDIYSKHHRTKNRYGYLFCHGERSPFLQKWIGKGKRVLDLGCRDGMLTESFARENEVIGADIDQRALDLCRERLGIEVVWVDLNTEWPWEKGSFDCMVACEILEHLFFIDAFLENVAKTLKPGGVFIGSVPNSFRMRNRWKFLLGYEYDRDQTHVRQFSYDKLLKVLDKYFREIEIHPIGGKILPWIPVSEKMHPKINRLFAKDLLFRAVVK